ncbi:MAG: SDR family NAD(P)-dependent oxidoreductase, partial [Acinetobacter baumannii]|nr:SDR family NAD(P)-dependent oxidoreductase [Acinetobacter baumannii]
MKIQGKHFVITGGGSGLGAATAEYLVKQGASVTLVDMNVEAGEQQAKQLGPKADFVKLDVTDEAAAEQFFKDVLAKHGHLYGLVNCAGIGPSAKVVGREGVHDLGLFAKTLNINVTGTFN